MVGVRSRLALHSRLLTPTSAGASYISRRRLWTEEFYKLEEESPEEESIIRGLETCWENKTFLYQIAFHQSGNGQLALENSGATTGAQSAFTAGDFMQSSYANAFSSPNSSNISDSFYSLFSAYELLSSQAPDYDLPDTESNNDSLTTEYSTMFDLDFINQTDRPETTPPLMMADEPVPAVMPICPNVNPEPATPPPKKGPKGSKEKPKPPGYKFLSKNNTVIIAQSGSITLLPCLIRNLCDGTVTWVRRDDFHLITVGGNTYAGDGRYSTMQKVHADEKTTLKEEIFSVPVGQQQVMDWSLQIKFVTPKDAGLYECQVSSHPPFKIMMRLVVVEARVEIGGPPERYVKTGSSLELLCKLIDSPAVPEFVFWYHNERMVNYDLGRGMNITTDLDKKQSSLVINKATRDHSGNYTCVASNATPDSIIVHILNGTNENPAAMQKGCGLHKCSNISHVLLTSVLIVLLLSVV